MDEGSISYRGYTECFVFNLYKGCVLLSVRKYLKPDQIYIPEADIEILKARLFLDFLYRNMEKNLRPENFGRNKDEPLRPKTQADNLSGKDSVSGEELKPSPRLCCSYRMLISIAGFLAFFNATLIRIGIVMAIVCMTETKSRNLTGGDGCPELVVVDRQGDMFEFSWSSTFQGFLKSASFYGFLVGPFVSGFLSFKFGGKIVLIIGTFCAGLSYVVIPELTRVNPYFFFGVRVLTGFFGGLIFPACFDILGHWAVPNERQVLIGGALIGVPLCSVLNFPLNGFLCTLLGWVWIFYFSTIWLSFYSVLAYFFVYDYPQECRYVSSREKDYIIPRTPGPVRGLKVPWRKIFTSVPIYAYVITHFCINYGFLTIILHLPVFMQEVHHFELRSNSVLSAAPYLGALASRIIITFTFNRIKDRFRVTTNCLRKTNVLIGVAIPCFTLIAVSFIPCKYRYLALASFILFATTLEMSISGGYLLSLIDMCPSYNNILTGIANAIANFAGLLSSVITGFFTPNGTHEEWNIVFYIAIGFFVVAGFSYIFFGTNELQQWGMVQPQTEEEGTKSRALSLVSIS